MSSLTLDQIIQHTASGFKLDLDGPHSLPHWHRVNQRGLETAEVTGANLKVVTLFAYLHVGADALFDPGADFARTRVITLQSQCRQ